MYGGQSTYIPLKVNQAGVIPIIFASSPALHPCPAVERRALVVAAQLGSAQPVEPDRRLVQSSSTALFIVLFTFFYVHVTFDPYQQADTIRKQGGYIPGFRPGAPTEHYLARILNRITLPGSLFLAAVALTPSILLSLWHITTIPFAARRS